MENIQKWNVLKPEKWLAAVQLINRLSLNVSTTLQCYKMKRLKSIIIFLVFIANKINSQELFVFTESASNMPSKSIGLRANNWLMLEQPGNSISYRFTPEIMWGINQKWMFHTEGFFSNANNAFSLDGGALYLKYRFFSNDDVFKHFRVAAFGRSSINKRKIDQQEIETNGLNTGYELGLITTQLLHKTALSISLSYEKALANFNNTFPILYGDKVINYSFSAGQLMLPKTYTDFKQVNVNLMLEMLGQTQLNNGNTFVDIAPSVQFIFNSQTRIDIGYKQQVYGDVLRSASNGFLFKIEHLLFNVL